MQTATAENMIDVYLGEKLQAVRENKENGALLLKFSSEGSEPRWANIMPYHAERRAKIGVVVETSQRHWPDYSSIELGPLSQFLDMNLVASEMHGETLRLYFEDWEGLDTNVMEITPYLELIGFSSANGSYYVKGIKPVLLHDKCFH